MAAPLWRFEFLGDFRATRDRTTITRLESRRALALLAALALSPQRRQTREELIERIWPDAPLEAGRNRLKQALASLRRQLEPPPLPPGSVFEADRFSLGLRAGAVTTDVAELEQALRRQDFPRVQALWRGELLPGLYEDWVQDERERLNALYARAPVLLEEAELLAALVPDEVTTPPAPSRRVELPVQVTRFFGRETEQTTLHALLQDDRWVSLTGPGGIGKTRLAIEVARGWIGGDVWFVPLAEASQGAHFGAALASALKLPLRAQTDPLEQALAFLGVGPALLVLDNAEQLVAQGLAGHLETLLERCPGVRLLVTTRQGLGGGAERLFPVPPLPLPQSESLLELAQLASVQLFLDRAQRARADVGLTARNAATLATLCQRLDGIPLALELVAAWAQALSPGQILARLEAGDTVVTTSRRRGGLERHRSLHHAFDGSFQRLSGGAQRFFTQLSVFRGGGTLEAAGAICDEPDAALLLTELADASLVQLRMTEQEELRFVLLESLRQFAAERLTESELTALQERHGAYYASLAARAARIEPPHDQAEWLNVLQEEWDNLRAAQQVAPLERALQLPCVLTDFLLLRGYVQEGIAWLEAALARPDAPRERAVQARAQLGALTPDFKGIPHARALLEEALAQAREHGLVATEAFVLFHLGRLAYLRYDLPGSWEWHVQARALRESLGEPGPLALSVYALAQLALRLPEPPEPTWELLHRAEALARQAGRQSTLAEILYESACVVTAEGDIEGAFPLLGASRTLARQLGSVRLEGKILNHLGELRRLQGNFAEAMVHYRAATQIFNQLRESGVTHVPIWNLGCCFEASQDWERALLLLACSAKLLDSVGRPIDDESRGVLEQYRQKVVETFGPARAEAIYARGYRMTVEEALALTEK
ncbi:ATP-binding protein [Armatimonas rosea]|uniref:Putative ATPase n=1 Tax=Armatimonas rosea TaxID=685828 RepID=A0A7W9W8P6_ARMRO|nr:winged helix-turn-helix domain-containing protein [Armatimonas rosea]MBB6052953.1 putative ATPase [Armatimonas rosea]